MKEKTLIEEDTKTWLKIFEELSGSPVVVSLLIEDGEIKFVSSISKSIYPGLESINSDDDVVLKKVISSIDKKKQKGGTKLSYVG